MYRGEVVSFRMQANVKMFGGLTIKGCKLSLCPCNKLESEEKTKTSRRLLNSEFCEKFLLLKNTTEIEYLDQQLNDTQGPLLWPRC